MKPAILVKALTAIVFAALIVTYGWWAPVVGLPLELPSSAKLQAWFNQFGALGPVAIVVSMTVAILVSPVPSAPIALAAGAIYGHFWGALYVLAGSELGALAAFGIARFLGCDVLRSWLGESVLTTSFRAATSPRVCGSTNSHG